ncbi:MAG: ParB/RepB/Spo0J family partition protein [Oscillatoriophycideae cyanobacterium NC_groundwater_1537_Pr4_S-0.65um_50_18]|nr:ParB/RepB/Spo0J family partition protein [Oscillatoriophycideae cyanobacterium NC_groundwater_1537_Pr4_S-0.65um_50_18]
MTKNRSAVPQMRGVSAFLSKPIETADATNTVSISKIRLPSNQPRRYFDPEKLLQLTNSVRQHGILEPLLVRPLPQGEYELVAGERRYRAAKTVGLEAVPVTVRELSDQEALQLALIENLQREDLNPIEETEGVLELLTITMGCNREEISEALAQMATAQKKGVELSGNVSRQVESIANVLESTISLTPESFRTSRLPLLNLPVEILNAVRQGKLEYTKARVIARLKNEQQREELLAQVVSQNLPLTEIKARLKELKPETEASHEQVLVDRMAEITKRLKKTKAWSQRKKTERITKLLDELEKLTEEG